MFCAVLGSLLFPDPVFAQRRKITSLVPENTPWGAALNRMAREWGTATNGEVELIVYHLNLSLLVIGCLIDIFSAILIVLPLIFPLSIAYRIDPVHLEIIFLINMETGFLTPPVGMNFFLASYRFKKPFVDISRYVVPFLLIQLGLIFIVTYVPILSTYLTRFF
jgi:TRAP-type C4-dicarboxylate transport system permease large subunit